MRVGQKVNVHFTTSHSLFDMEILYCPCATGDSWILRGPDGREHHVMLFAHMEERADTMEGANLHPPTPQGQNGTAGKPQVGECTTLKSAVNKPF